MKEQGLITSTIILTFSSFLTRTLGMVSVVFLSHLLGANGMGLYQLTMTVYMIAIVLATAGLSVSISKLIAEELGQKHFGNIHKVMQIAFTFSGLLSLCVAMLLFVLAPTIATVFIGEAKLTLAIRILSFSLPLIACSSCFKGYFYATKKAILPASGEILEQLIKISLIIVLSHLYHNGDLELTYALLALSFTLSEMTSWIYYLSLYVICQKHTSTPTSAHTSGLFSKLLITLLPMATISYLSSFFVSTENMLIPMSLKKYGATPELSLSLYGMLKGMVMPILFFPSAFLTAFSTTLIPEIARANVLGHKQHVKHTTEYVLRFTFILGILVTSIFMTYSHELGITLYHNADIGPMLKILAITVPFIYTEIVCDGILNGLGKQLSCLKYSLFDAVFRITMIYFILPIKGFNVLIIIMIISNIITSLLCLNKVLECTPFKLSAPNLIFKPALAAMAGGTFSRFIINRCISQTLPLTCIMALGIILIIVIYTFLLFLMECLNYKDLSKLLSYLPNHSLNLTRNQKSNH